MAEFRQKGGARGATNRIQLADILGHNNPAMILDVDAPLTPVHGYDVQARIFDEELLDH